MEGDTTDLMQRTGKRKRGSPEPALRGAGSTEELRGTVSRGRRPVPKASARPEPTDHCEGEEEEGAEVAEEEPSEGVEAENALPDDEEIHYREEHYQHLRRVGGSG